MKFETKFQVLLLGAWLPHPVRKINQPSTTEIAQERKCHSLTDAYEMSAFYGWRTNVVLAPLKSSAGVSPTHLEKKLLRRIKEFKDRKPLIVRLQLNACRNKPPTYVMMIEALRTISIQHQDRTIARGAETKIPKDLLCIRCGKTDHLLLFCDCSRQLRN